MYNSMVINGFKILNTPDYAKDRKFIVATWVDDDLWFYGAYDDETRANAATMYNGVIRRVFVRG